MEEEGGKIPCLVWSARDGWFQDWFFAEHRWTHAKEWVESGVLEATNVGWNGLQRVAIDPATLRREGIPVPGLPDGTLFRCRDDEGREYLMLCPSSGGGR